MANARKTYYSMVTLEGGAWAPQFGDFDREVVEAEVEAYRDSYDLKASQVKIIKSAYRDSVEVVREWCEKANEALEAKREAKRIASPKSAIIWEGASAIDGSPIAVVATIGSKNGKTGDMVQTWIIRTDMSPLEASRTGLDRAICGDCPHRGVVIHGAKMAQNRACYVNIGQAPLAVYKALKRGSYDRATSTEARAAIGRGRMVRIGSYGDGAMVPAQVWRDLTRDAIGKTGYSHQFDTVAGTDASLFMQSADSLDAATTAWSVGRRTFRIVRDVSEIVKGAEVECPSARGVQCADCGLCDGSKRAKSVAIVVHGTGAKHFASVQ
jgi:hypothetical protein